MTENTEKVEKVLLYYSNRIKKTPEMSVNYVLRSACYESLGKYKLSLNDANKIRELEPNYWIGHYQALKMYLKLKNSTEAEKIAAKFEQDQSFQTLIEELKDVQQSNQTEMNLQGVNPRSQRRAECCCNIL